MKNMNDILEILIDKSRREEDRLDSILELKNFLEDEKLVFKIAGIAKSEESQVIRKALLSIITEIPITKISNRLDYVDILYYFASIENESTLRIIATGKIVELTTQDENLEILLSEILANESSKEIQELCIMGLSKSKCSNKIVLGNIEKYLTNYINELSDELFIILNKFDNEDSERIMMTAYSPYNSIDIRLKIISELLQRPSINSQTYEKLFNSLLVEKDNMLINNIIQLFTSKVVTDSILVDLILSKLVEDDDSNESLVQLLENLVESNENVLIQIKTIFLKSKSSQLKINILNMLQHANIIEILLEAVLDNNYFVRKKAVENLFYKFDQDPEKIAKTFLEILNKQVPYYLAEQLVDALTKVQVLRTENEKLFLDYYQKTEDPVLLEKLSLLLMKIPVNTENSKLILNSYLKLLENNAYSKALKNDIIEQLSNFNLTDNIEVKACLEQLMLYEADMETLTWIYNTYKKFRDNSNDEVKFILKLFFKFAHYYPNNLTETWISEFKNLINTNDDIKKTSDHLIWITEDHSLILDKGTKDLQSSVVSTIIEALKNRNLNKAEDILDDAYNNGAMTKSEITFLFKWNLNCHAFQYPLAQKIILLLIEAQLFTTEIIEYALKFIEDFPGAYVTDILKELVEEAVEKNENLNQSIIEKINQEHYERFINRKFEKEGYSKYGANYAGFWWKTVLDWPLFEIISKDKTEKLLYKRIFELPIKTSIAENNTIQYFALKKLNNKSLEFDLYETLVEFIDKLDENFEIGSLYDRACHVFFSAYTNSICNEPKEEIPETLVKKATEILLYYYKQYKVWNNKTEYFIELPYNIDIVYLKEIMQENDLNFEEFTEPLKQHVKAEEGLIAKVNDKKSKCPTMLPLTEVSDDSINDFLFYAYSLPANDENIEYLVKAIDWKNSLDSLISRLDKDIQLVVNEYLN